VKHSHEPWTLLKDTTGRRGIGCPGGQVFWTVSTQNELIGAKEASFQDLKRIVACVNAFTGFPTEAIGPFMEKIRYIMARYDKNFEHCLDIYAQTAAEQLKEGFDILHQHGMEWEENS
jgi:hypothetical protein